MGWQFRDNVGRVKQIGLRGVTGEPGGALTIPYTFNSSTATGDPGTGKLDMDDPTHVIASTRVTVSITDSGGASWGATLGTFLSLGLNPVLGMLRLTKSDDVQAFVVFEVTAFSTVVSGVTVAYNLTVVGMGASGGTPFNDGDDLLFFFDITGNQGDTGATGAAGPNTVTASTTTNLTGVLKGDGANVGTATQGTDYYKPGGTDVAVADGGTGSSTASGARTNLGLVIGTDVEAHDSDLTTIAGLDSGTSGAIASDGAGWIKKTYAQFKTALSLVKADVGLGSVDNTADTAKPVSTAQQTAIDLKVTANGAITGATKTKITYDTKGLITSGADATTADIADSTNKRYVTDAQQTVIGNTSGTNTGDQTVPGFATNAVVLGTAASAGAASTVMRSNDTIAAFDATVPVTQAFGDSAATGSAAVASRRDHKHAMPSFGTNAIVLGTAAAAGSATTPFRTDDTIAAFDATVPTTQDFGDAAAVGTAAFAARRDHKHAWPVNLPQLLVLTVNYTVPANSSMVFVGSMTLNAGASITVPSTSVILIQN